MHEAINAIAEVSEDSSVSKSSEFTLKKRMNLPLKLNDLDHRRDSTKMTTKVQTNTARGKSGFRPTYEVSISSSDSKVDKSLSKSKSSSV